MPHTALADAAHALMGWIGSHPVETGLLIAALPLLLVGLQALLGRRGAPPAAGPAAAPEAEGRAAAPRPAQAAPEREPARTPEPAAAREAAPAPAREPAPPAEVAPEPPAEPEPAAEPAPIAEPVPEPEPVAEAPPAPRGLRGRLSLTRDNLVGRLGAILSGRTVGDEVLDELEMLLFSADLGVKTAESLLDTVRSRARGADAEGVRALLRGAILEKLQRVEPPPPPAVGGAQGPHVILVLGVNGSGKTTTIGKLAARYRAAGHSVILGAGDTFRAAAREQLETWGERVGCDVVTGVDGGDPSAVAFDTVKAAVARKMDVAIIDTAGRLQTKKPLMEELGKLVRVIGRDLPGAPHETLLVLDANTGQNAISQAQLFSEVARVTGLVLTKLDGTAKGGVLVGLADAFGIPVQYVGVGEAVEDLRDFSAEEFVDAVFEG